MARRLPLIIHTLTIAAMIFLYVLIGVNSLDYPYLGRIFSEGQVRLFMLFPVLVLITGIWSGKEHTLTLYKCFGFGWLLGILLTISLMALVLGFSSQLLKVAVACIGWGLAAGTIAAIVCWVGVGIGTVFVIVGPQREQ